MSMRNLPATNALQGGTTGGSARGQPLNRVQEGLEEDSSEEEEDRSSSKLSTAPSTNNPRGTQVGLVIEKL